MKCSKAYKLISPYIDGELPQEDMQAVEDHMKVCRKCREELEEGKELQNLFAKAENFKTPYGFHTRVMATISAGNIKVSSRFPVFVQFAEAIAIIAVIVFGIRSGSMMIKGYPQNKTRNVMASLSLDVFAPAPPDSLAGAYLAMTEERDEK
jgi:anti-sigma factor RsiW